MPYYFNKIKNVLSRNASFVQGILTCNHQNRWTDFSLIDPPVESHLHVGTDTIRSHEVMEIMDDRKPFSRDFVIGVKDKPKPFDLGLCHHYTKNIPWGNELFRLQRLNFASGKIIMNPELI